MSAQPARRPLAHGERIAWARLARTPGVGPVSFARLIGRFGGPAAALEALPSLTRERPLTPPPAAHVEAELAALAEMDARLVCACEPDFPPLLAALDPPPAMIATRGDVGLLARPTVALVGARDGSAAGLKMAALMAEGLGAAGFTVVSGLARGIDAAAHRASLASGTAAVLAGGLDRPYPPQNLALHEEIIAHGCVLAEAPLGQEPRARDFPRRNHVISGLSLGVVVIEAAQRSGSLITAHAAADQGREVMAVPGSPLDPRARGGNRLLRGGATLVETPEDVIEALGGAFPRRPPAPGPLFAAPTAAPPLADLPARLCALLSPTPIHLNDLARLLGAPAGQAAAALMELELAGRAASLPGGYAAMAGAAFQPPRD